MWNIIGHTTAKSEGRNEFQAGKKAIEGNLWSFSVMLPIHAFK